MIDPKCLNGKTCFGYSAEGYILPCCWVDHPSIGNEFEKLKQEKFKICNCNSIEEILMSEEWQNFYNTIINDQDNAPQLCKNFCRTDYLNKDYEDYTK